MRTVWVTGLSGAGKSAVSRRLAAWGHRAVSTDGAPDLCGWVDRAGRPSVRPDHPDLAWLAAHAWVWDPARLDALIATERDGGAGRLWLCGTADNATDLADRFDLVVLLHIDLGTMLARLDNPSRGNDFGRAGRTRDHLRAHAEDRQRQLERHADVVIDGTVDLDTVAAQLVRVSGPVRRDSPRRGVGQTGPAARL